MSDPKPAVEIDRTELNVIAWLLTKVTEGSRELDTRIHVAIFRPGSAITRSLDGDSYWYKNAQGHNFNDIAPRYTTSIEAALTLLPDDSTNEITNKVDWQLESTNGGLTINARVGNPDNKCFADTPALALCAASLTARVIFGKS